MGVRASADRRDAPVWTLARADTASWTADLWYFTVEWLTRPSSLSRGYSLNVFDVDLSWFELFEGGCQGFGRL
ncbi:hypothetical protein YTPLAS18_14870 [Nitrospira sp.]|nr:hypothetical protein YTPLAS18_14870 [Nitrospira sp.]